MFQLSVTQPTQRDPSDRLPLFRPLLPGLPSHFTPLSSLTSLPVMIASSRSSLSLCSLAPPSHYDCIPAAQDESVMRECPEAAKWLKSHAILRYVEAEDAETRNVGDCLAVNP